MSGSMIMLENITNIIGKNSYLIIGEPCIIYNNIYI